MKNAYVLIGKQRYILAAAFYLLAGKIEDAKDARNILVKFANRNDLAEIVEYNIIPRLLMQEKGQSGDTC